MKINKNCGNRMATVPLNTSISLHLNLSCFHVDPPQPIEKNGDQSINKHGHIFEGKVKKTEPATSNLVRSPNVQYGMSY